MIKKARWSTGEPRQPTLQMPRAEAAKGIQEQIERGKNVIALAIANEDELNQARSEYYKWSDYNRELLKHIVDSDSLATEYTGIYIGGFGGRVVLEVEVKGFRRDVQGKIDRLESILGRLELIPEASSVTGSIAQSQTPVPRCTDRVFLVHGHDEGVREATARFLEKLGLKPVVLHEQPNKGRTIIEKFEDYTDVGFAVVLLTPDDRGGTNDTPYEGQKLRARQNVILELGFFMGSLGRGRVCALYQEGVEIPSDYHGVAFISIDPAGAWKLLLSKELKAAGIPIDINHAV